MREVNESSRTRAPGDDDTDRLGSTMLDCLIPWAKHVSLANDQNKAPGETRIKETLETANKRRLPQGKGVCVLYLLPKEDRATSLFPKSQTASRSPHLPSTPQENYSKNANWGVPVVAQW